MDIKKILMAHLLVLALVFPQAVSAADFNLKLTTALSNLHPDVTAIKIGCKTSEAGGHGEKIIGVGSTTEKVPANGEVNKTISVSFNANSGKNPSDAKQYLCTLSLINKSGIDRPRPATANVCNDVNNDWKCGTQGKPFKYLISGSIP